MAGKFFKATITVVIIVAILVVSVGYYRKHWGNRNFYSTNNGNYVETETEITLVDENKCCIAYEGNEYSFWGTGYTVGDKVIATIKLASNPLDYKVESVRKE